MSPLQLNVQDMVQQADAQDIVSRQKNEELKKIRKACKDFESIFTYQLLKTMRQTVPKASGMGNFTGKDTYNMIADQKVAEEMSRQGNGLGLQKMLFEQLTKNLAGEGSRQKVK
jgi:flagellar protein FlgJ